MRRNRHPRRPQSEFQFHRRYRRWRQERGVRELPAPYGVSDDVWWGVQTRIRSLTEAIEMEAEDEAVEQGARTLADLLRSFV